MDASVRQARPSDAADIARLTSQLGYDVASSEVSARLSRILARPDHHFLIAEHDGQPVGWAHAVVAEFVELDRFVLIAGLVVDRDHRRSGIGRLLMARAESWAKTRGCSVVRLWSTTARTTAHRFYEHLGYTNIKTQYSFVKSLDAQLDPARFAPRVDQS